MLPWGTKIRLEKQIEGTAWRLVASRLTEFSVTSLLPFPAEANPKFQNRLAAIILKGPIFISDYQADMAKAAEILRKDFSPIYKKPVSLIARVGPSSATSARSARSSSY